MPITNESLENLFTGNSTGIFRAGDKEEMLDNLRTLVLYLEANDLEGRLTAQMVRDGQEYGLSISR